VNCRHLSPGDVARQLGVRDAKIYAWIESGELRASNVAACPGGLPRYKVSPTALEEFLTARQVVPALVPVRRRKRSDAVIEFFS
jgi:excisionase family DNA binding protein